jgi:hypothetical protein
VVHGDLVLVEVVLERQVLLPESEKAVVGWVFKEEGGHVGMGLYPKG